MGFFDGFEKAAGGRGAMGSQVANLLGAGALGGAGLGAGIGAATGEEGTRLKRALIGAALGGGAGAAVPMGAAAAMANKKIGPRIEKLLKRQG